MSRRTGEPFRLPAVLTLVAAVAFAGCTSNAGSESKPGAGSNSGANVTVSVGRVPSAAGNSPITEYMLQRKLFEEAAKKYGYNLTVDYRDYPTAIPIIEAMVANQLDIGLMGNTPTARVISQNQPLSVLSMSEGHLRFILTTRKGNGIHNMGDLNGKTVGVSFGADPQNAFSQMLRWTLGSADASTYGINLVNTPTLAQAATVPQGTDATSVTYPALLAQQLRDPDVVGVINSFGYTEDNYQGPEGSGAGHALPQAQQSPFYPEGFYLHRTFWIARNQFLDQNPKLAVAFMEAEQQATEQLSKMDPADVAKLVQKAWGLPPDVGAKVVKDELLFIRGWVWVTQGDAYALPWVSQFMAQAKIIDQPLTWSQVTAAMERAAPLEQEAYQATGSTPPAEAFSDPNASDKRGPPIWELKANWQEPPPIPS